jgi:hypothetical protein
MIYLLLFSCISFPKLSELPGFYSGYNRLDDKDKECIVFLGQNEKISDVCTDKKKIYAIDAYQLLEYMKQYDSCIVYFWSLYCSSPVCISPATCQDYCDRNGYLLILVAEYYTFPEMYSFMPLITNPIFSINMNYYKTDYCPRYVNRFTKELLGKEHYKEYSRYWIFKKGMFERGINNLPL